MKVRRFSHDFNKKSMTLFVFKLFEAHRALVRIGQPEDIAPAVVFLASPDAGWITGETLLISGGYR
jgi:3-oxoacyl-[acyl-carrier protein] reductase